MNKKIIPTIILSAVLLTQGMAEERNFLTKTYPQPDVARVLLPREQFRPFDDAIRTGWPQVSDAVKRQYIADAEKLLGTSWGELKATEFMQFKRTGNRSVFEGASFGRRNMLAILVTGEMFENKGRFTDDIVNGIWAICEESWWGVPAHNGYWDNREPLPNLDDSYVDLFDAETGAILAWCHYLMKDKLEQISLFITKRITDELERRIIIPCMKNDYNWMGFHGESLNNWTPWICSNWLTVALLCDKNADRRAQAVYRAMQAVDNFMNPYPADGGCDEGPGYWGRAGASLFDCLELLYTASSGQIDIFDRPLVKNIANYIYKTHIADDYYVNFADAGAVSHPDANLIYRYGEYLGDETMRQFGLYLAERYKVNERPARGSLGRILPALYVSRRLAGEGHAPLLRDVWFPELQVMIARSYDRSAAGLYLAVKGGHNAESHNHNDVGNFVVYADGKPVLIDVGVETYTAKTFGPQRYEIWTMQSAYHNVPTVNGVQQMPGRRFAATDVSCSSTNSRAVFSLDMTFAYPESAKLTSWKRTVTLNRRQKVDVEDDYLLMEAVEPLKWHLMSCLPPDGSRPGIITLGDGKVTVLYDESALSVDVENIDVDDSRLTHVWGNRLYRITLTNVRPQALKGKCKVSIVYGK
jgi:hypothetical protein